MDFSKKAKFNPWKVVPETQRGRKVLTIKRWVRNADGTAQLERLPVKFYSQWRNNPSELEKLVLRLNDSISQDQRAKEVVEIKHAFISPEFLEGYREYLSVQIPSQRQAQTEYFNLVNYFLNFFIGKLNLKNPLEWHLIHETEWAKYLVSSEAPKSVNSKKNIIFAANRFMAYLHKRRPSEVPPLKFSPITKAKFKEIQAKRVMKGENVERKLITQLHWQMMTENAPSVIKPFMMLAFHYGLRKSETLGVTLEDVRKAHLSVERQLSKITGGNPLYSILKGREERKVPHWCASPAQAYLWIESALKNLRHPSTLGHVFGSTLFIGDRVRNFQS